jgi:hypothetical protein
MSKNASGEKTAINAIEALIQRGDLLPKSEVTDTVELIRKRVGKLFGRMIQNGDYFTPLATVAIGMLKTEDLKSKKSYDSTARMLNESVTDLQSNISTLKTLMKRNDFKSLNARRVYLKRLEKLADEMDNPANFKEEIVDIYKMLGDWGVNIQDVKVRLNQLEGKCKLQSFFESTGYKQETNGKEFDLTNIAMESETEVEKPNSSGFADHFKKIIPQR